MKPLLLPLLAAMVAGCAVNRKATQGERLLDVRGQELECIAEAISRPGMSESERGFLVDSCRSAYEVVAFEIKAPADIPFDQALDQAVRETDAEFCKKATEAWQVRAFCHQGGRP